MPAIVTDSRYRMSLAVIRSLGRAGIRVTCQEVAGSDPRDALGFHSRHAAEKVFTASPREDPGGFVDDILRLAAGHDVLIPVSLASILAVAGRAADVRRYLKVALPSLEAIETANATDRLLAVARQVGVPVPATTILPPGQDPVTLADNLDYPVVIKYREGENLQLPPEYRYAIVRDRESFLAVYRAMSARQSSPLVQEYVDGDGYGMSALFNQASEPVAAFCHRRVREYPVSGGPSCFCESVHDERLVDYGLRLLRALRWHGVAMVEFKRDRVSGEYRLMEINPRFWGSLPLAVAAGVDFPVLLYRVARGEGVRPVMDYRPGVRMRYLFQDLLSARGYLAREPDRRAFLMGFLRDLADPRVVDGVFQLEDPRPGLVYALRALRRLGHGDGDAR